MNKFKEMSFKEKKEYIWEYYKPHIFIFAAIIILVAWGVFRRPVPIPDPYLYIAWFAPITPSQVQDLENELSIIIEESANYNIFIGMYSLPDEMSQAQLTMWENFRTMLSLGRIDIIVFDNEYSNFLHDSFAPLDPILDYLPADITERIVPLFDSQVISLTGSSMQLPSTGLFIGLPIGTENYMRIAEAILVILYE